MRKSYEYATSHLSMQQSSSNPGREHSTVCMTFLYPPPAPRTHTPRTSVPRRTTSQLSNAVRLTIDAVNTVRISSPSKMCVVCVTFLCTASFCICTSSFWLGFKMLLRDVYYGTNPFNVVCDGLYDGYGFMGVHTYSVLTVPPSCIPSVPRIESTPYLGKHPHSFPLAITPARALYLQHTTHRTSQCVPVFYRTTCYISPVDATDVFDSNSSKHA
ncbi:hypothetical protein BDW22DRAFT_825185 [Trametopsis cervina]|nr:hypothetical protein BDW22DRAFT_825185 [Trametopsis cervina]